MCSKLNLTSYHAKLPKNLVISIYLQTNMHQIIYFYDFLPSFSSVYQQKLLTGFLLVCPFSYLYQLSFLMLNKSRRVQEYILAWLWHHFQLHSRDWNKIRTHNLFISTDFIEFFTTQSLYANEKCSDKI